MSKTNAFWLLAFAAIACSSGGAKRGQIVAAENALESIYVVRSWRESRIAPT